jgi:hypothetical protein
MKGVSDFSFQEREGCTNTVRFWVQFKTQRIFLNRSASKSERGIQDLETDT